MAQFMTATVDRSDIANIGKEFALQGASGDADDHGGGAEEGNPHGSAQRGDVHSATVKAGQIAEKYRLIRQEKIAAKDRARLVMGRKTLQQQATDVAGKYLRSKSSDRWVK